jgi:hypothetical protein
VYAYLRLAQRELKTMPDKTTQVRMARRALLYTSFNLAGVVILSFLAILPTFLFVPYLVQWLETIWGTLNPAVGAKPTRIGIRQLAVSSLFTVLFILTWSI